VIAAIAGTHLILPEDDRRMIVGYLVNKFRGDVSLFEDGLAAIDRFTGWRSFGVVPWLREAALLPSEDAVVLERPNRSDEPKCRVVVPMLSRIANFDDLDPLRAEPGVEVVFVPPGRRLPPDAALIVIPGSKATIADLAMLRDNGWDKDIVRHRRRGGRIVGLCGGYQMLGRSIRDPHGVEGTAREAEGLGMLDVETVLLPDKTVREVAGRSLVHDEPVSGYEIHLGRTTGPDTRRPPVTIDGVPDGACSADGKVWGTYLHGIFGADRFRGKVLAELGLAGGGSDYRAGVEAALDAIAAHLEEHADVDALLAAAR
jgi:adenosylcobyric acid synthase